MSLKDVNRVIRDRRSMHRFYVQHLGLGDGPGQAGGDGAPPFDVDAKLAQGRIEE